MKSKYSNVLRTSKVIGLILMLVLFFYFLETTKDVRVSWVFVAGALLVSSCYLVVYGRNWWKNRMSRVAKQERFLKFLLNLMGFFMATGTAIFLHTFYLINIDMNGYPYWVNAYYLLHAAICSIDLFMLDVEVDILNAISVHEMLRGVIAIQAVLSFSCTLALLGNLVYVRLRAYMKLHQQTKVDAHHNHMYLFFGMNEPAEVLARSIREKEGERAQIIFVEYNQKDEENQDGWNAIIGFFAQRKQVYSGVDEIDARVTFTEAQLCDLKREDDGISDILTEMNLTKLRSLLLKLEQQKEAKELNYVVLAMSDEEVGMTCAIRIFNYVRKHRENLKNLRILVRVYHREKEMLMHCIAKHYNEGYNLDAKEEYRTEKIIIPFGQMEEIYSYRMIVGERLIQEGRNFFVRYAQLKGENSDWAERRELLMGLSKKVKDEQGNKRIVKVPVGERKISIDNMRSLRRMESQDEANAFHVETKMFLLCSVLPDDFNKEDFLQRYFTEDGKPRCRGHYDHIVYRN